VRNPAGFYLFSVLQFHWHLPFFFRKNTLLFGICKQSLEHWINDGLMTIFFLLIGLELERELYIGELSNVKESLLPIFAAIVGMCIPAGLYLLFNYNTESQSGAGIPMATDIAFA
jgi:Na+:H+ antiporter, NhaA family